jgi:ribosomal protein L9
MKVVLLENIPGKGRAGEIKEVSTGFARNFLLPRGLALVATPSIIKETEARLEKEREEETIDRDRLLNWLSKSKERRFISRPAQVPEIACSALSRLLI